jgi:hypothetical protein
VNLYQIVRSKYPEALPDGQLIDGHENDSGQVVLLAAPFSTFVWPRDTVRWIEFT